MTGGEIAPRLFFRGACRWRKQTQRGRKRPQPFTGEACAISSLNRRMRNRTSGGGNPVSYPIMPEAFGASAQEKLRLIKSAGKSCGNR
jgi:hypothetical protein